MLSANSRYCPHGCIQPTDFRSAVERMGEEGLPLELLSPHSEPAASYRQLWAEMKAELWD